MQPATPRLSDKDLLAALHHTHDRANRANVDFLIHLAEVDARELYLREACSSMFTYCTERLRMAEGTAYRSIATARAGRSFPLVFEMMRRNEVHVASVAMLAKYLTPDNHEALLARAKHQSKRAVERLVAELHPIPDAADVIRRLAPPPAVAVPAPALALAAAPPPMLALSPPVPPAEISPKQTPRGPSPKILPTAPNSYRIAFNGDDELVTLLDEVSDLLAHRVERQDVASVVRVALLNLRENLLRERAAHTKRPPKVAPVAPSTDQPASPRAEPPTPPAPASRHVPSHIRREVWARDGARCTFTSSSGERCTETSMLELEHLKPFAIHHEHRVEDICLRCRPHNQWGATQVYGADHMAEFRRGRPPGGASTS